MSLRHWAPQRKFFALLVRCDRDLAAQVGASIGCPRCGSKLHRADYPRKPLGGGEFFSGLVRRVSFCCSQRECRRRFTPPSFVFADRKWYVLAVVVLAAALGPAAQEHVTDQLALAGTTLSLRSVRRWQAFFREGFTGGAAFAWLRARLSPPPAAAKFPLALLGHAQRGGCDSPDQSIAQSISWLVLAGLGSRIPNFEGQITIRRDWHC